MSAAEIAAEDLPGLSPSTRVIARLAKRQQWQGRARAGRGGGIEYAIDSLPAQARAAYVGRHVSAIDVPSSIAREAASEDAAAGLKVEAAEARDARLALLALAERFAGEARLSRNRADRQVCDLYNAGSIDVAGWIRREVKSLTPRTLARWRKAQGAGESARLAVDRSAARRGTGVLDRADGGAVKTYILALVAKQPQLTAHHIRALVADQFPALRLPPVRAFQRALKAWRHDYRNALRAVRDPDGFKSAIRFAARVATPASRLNELWQIDASPADMLCTDGRHSLYIGLDIYSRRMIGLVSKTPRASAVGLLIRKAILTWGVPERIKTDNGSDFVARSTQRLFAALAIEHETSAPFSPEQKGHVERAIGTLQHGLMRTLPGFVGHSVADRKIIEGRKSFARRLGETAEDMFEVSMSAAELQRAVDDWCGTVYAQAPHAGLKGATPFAAAASYAGAIRHVADERALDLLLAPVAGKDGLRTVTKSGIRIDGAYYIGGFLDVGAEVMVRMDKADMGRCFVFAPDGLTFLGEAMAPELAGIDPAAAIAAARAEQKKRIDQALTDVRKETRKIKAKDMAPAIHRQALIAAGKLAEFPKRTETHATPALAAAADAAAGNDNAPVHDPAVIALAEVLQAEALQAEANEPAAPVTPLRKGETAHQRWQRARAIEEAMARGEDVAPDDLLWLGGYRDGPEYRGFAMTYETTSSAIEG